MNAYFFKMTNEERENILDQHKTVYDGYVTSYVQPEKNSKSESEGNASCGSIRLAKRQTRSG